MDVILPIILFSVGLVLIIKGADWLTEGAANIAHHYGIPTIVVGLTIVAVGSSAPEFVVSVISAIQGNADIALGNVVGSNIFNILAIMGVTAIVRPIEAARNNIKYDIPFLVLANLVIAITAFDKYFDPMSKGSDSVSRTDGLLMLCMFAIFMSYTYSIANLPSAATSPSIANTPDSTSSPASAMEAEDTKKGGILRSVLFVIVGLVLLVLGGDWLVDGASGIASQMGLSDSIIALTIVSGGTSAPEMAASVMAAKKGDTAMAVGNIVGSVVFNVFFVLGTAAAIHPLGIGGITVFDIIYLLGSSVLLWVLCRFGKHHLTLTRTEGWVMVILAVLYYAVLVINELRP